METPEMSGGSVREDPNSAGGGATPKRKMALRRSIDDPNATPKPKKKLSLKTLDDRIESLENTDVLNVLEDEVKGLQREYKRLAEEVGGIHKGYKRLADEMIFLKSVIAQGGMISGHKARAPDPYEEAITAAERLVDFKHDGSSCSRKRKGSHPMRKRMRSRQRYQGSRAVAIFVETQIIGLMSVELDSIASNHWAKMGDPRFE
ncbi:hypothetical protein SUGI_1154960 [Cryptomeria japonica]|nr:hypothetical protein SUGI_1154960 [Cryptomeria japonica]